MSLTEVKLIYEKLKSAIDQPILYVYHFFEALKNEIDIHCQLKLNKKDQDQIYALQALLIDKVQQFESYCMSRLSEIAMEGIRNDYQSFINQIEVIIASQASHKTELETTQEILLDKLYEVEKFLFQNNTILFTELSGMEKRLFYIEDCFIKKVTCKFNSKKIKEQQIKYKLLEDNLPYLCKLNDQNLFVEPNNKLINMPVIAKFSDLTCLNLSNSGITQLDNEPFQGLINLTDLDLTGNQLVQLNEKSFEGLISLEALYLACNQLVDLKKNCFECLCSLTELYLEENRLVQLDNKPFKGLTSLIELNIGKNCLKKLQNRPFEGLTSLQYLRLDRNFLNDIDEKLFSGLIELRVLKLSVNNLVELECRQFEGLINLESLYLDFNHLTCIGKKLFKGLKSLNSLFINDNKILKIDKNIVNELNALKILMIFNNKIEKHQIKNLLSGLRSNEF